ncbi:GntR family transcriptional regulator [Streptomyces sp. 3N207]|uniref:GntR family transcriptional regulator n=1 Tax=Streptomyces sp. 3N207 TaxID=3457417 RepID=UPI003FD1867D
MDDLHGPAALTPVKRESTAGIIARQLRGAITDGSLAPGMQLGEVKLAQRLMVSRGVLREAMQRLVQEGLVRSLHNRGLFVAKLSDDDIRDIYFARQAVERAAVAAILQRDPKGSADRLAVAHDRMREAARQRDGQALSNEDIAFHEVLVNEAGSDRLKRLHETLLVETRMCIAALEDTYSAPDETVQEHGAIVDALRERDKDRLDRLITDHATDALSRLLPGPDGGDPQSHS